MPGKASAGTTARTFEVCRQGETDAVGYYTLVASPVEQSEAADEVQRGASKHFPIPVWFEQGIDRIQCISWDSAVGRRWAQLLADLRRHGMPMSIKDSLIAATALAHDLPLVTLNQRDFRPAKVRLVDPSS